jgi:signal transduction histidine kinase
VASLAERCPIPVELRVSLDNRLPAPTEVAAYYVVSEALANVMKHSGASMVTVEIERDSARLRVEVVDDGVGGARARTGSGLEGLADRVAALDGELRVESEPGRGTRVRADIPCR